MNEYRSYPASRGDFRSVWDGEKWRWDEVMEICGESDILENWLRHPCATVDRAGFRRRLYRWNDPVIALYRRRKNRVKYSGSIPAKPGEAFTDWNQVFWNASQNAWQPRIYLRPRFLNCLPTK